MLFRICALLAAGAAALWCQPFYLHSGDRVVFYGDSITDQRLYTTFVETYVVTRFPDMNVTFVHSGWGGDRVTGGGGGGVDVRLQRDVLPYKPTVVTIMLGMNDAGYKPYDQGLFDTFAKGYEHIIDTLKKADPGVRITLIKPSPYDDVTQTPKFEGGYNAVLIKYGDYLHELAEKDHLDFADLNTPVTSDLKKAMAIDSASAGKLIPDRVHPGPAGHLLMAEALLNAWHAPALVSSVEIDAAGGHMTKAENTRVTNVRKLFWTEQDAALPLPIDYKDNLVSLAAKASGIADALDREMLKVTGLDPGRYALKIDGEEIAAFDAGELALGVNLGRYATPMMKQALEVHQLTLQRANAHNIRWRNMQVPYQDVKSAEKEAIMVSLDKFDRELAQKQHAAAKPAVHNYELSPRP